MVDSPRDAINQNTNMPSLGRIDLALPALITQNGEQTTKRFLEYFTARIRNPHTRRAYSGLLGFTAYMASHPQK
jgi:hypothetical protein